MHIFLLALSLLFVQWVGVSHKVAHSEAAATAQVLHALAGYESSAASEHGHALNSAECKLFDACTLADVTVATPPLHIAVACAVSSRIAFASPARSRETAFAQARGPPTLV